MFEKKRNKIKRDNLITMLLIEITLLLREILSFLELTFTCKTKKRNKR